MSKTLQEIVDEQLKPTDVTTLKALNTEKERCQKEYDDAPSEPKDAKEAKKVPLDKALKAFEDKKNDFAGRIRNAINAEFEKDNLAVYSTEVAERRKARKIGSIEDDITKSQGSIDILSLRIDTIDKEIEEIRKGLSVKA